MCSHEHAKVARRIVPYGARVRGRYPANEMMAAYYSAERAPSHVTGVLTGSWASEGFVIMER